MTCFVADGDADLHSVLGMASRCWSATGAVVEADVVADGVLRWVNHDDDDDRGGVGEQGRERDHRGAWQGYGHYNYYCLPVAAVGRTYLRCPNTAYRLSLKRVRLLVVVNFEPGNTINSIIFRRVCSIIYFNCSSFCPIHISNSVICIIYMQSHKTQIYSKSF